MPATFVAVTVNVYGVPFVNPGTVHDSAPVVEQVSTIRRRKSPCSP